MGKDNREQTTFVTNQEMRAQGLKNQILIIGLIANPGHKQLRTRAVKLINETGELLERVDA